MLSADRIDARAILAFGGLHGQAHLLAERAGKEAAHTMGLPTGGSHQFQKRRSTFTAQQRQNLGFLTALAGWGRLLLRAGLVGALWLSSVPHGAAVRQPSAPSSEWPPTLGPQPFSGS